jgi:glycyl-tRNA synthetase beta subunit
LELGSEELPSADVINGIEQIEANLAKLLQENRLAYTSLRVTGTPRRLAALITGLAPAQSDDIVERRGPDVGRAFDSLGEPTKAAEGFARGQGVAVDQLEVRDNYVYAVKRVAGRPTVVVLPELCTTLLDSLRWGKTMRWNRSNVGYPRPLRWIVALYDDQIVPFTWAGIVSGNSSRGPRFADATARLAAGEFTTFALNRADDYFDAVAQNGIVIDRAQRRQRIVE